MATSHTYWDNGARYISSTADWSIQIAGSWWPVRAAVSPKTTNGTGACSAGATRARPEQNRAVAVLNGSVSSGVAGLAIGAWHTTRVELPTRTACATSTNPHLVDRSRDEREHRPAVPAVASVAPCSAGHKVKIAVSHAAASASAPSGTPQLDKHPCRGRCIRDGIEAWGRILRQVVGKNAGGKRHLVEVRVRGEGDIRPRENRHGISQ